MSPVRFVAQPSGRIVAKLGRNIVGEAREWDGGRSTRAYWRCVLPMPDGTTPAGMPKGAASIEIATRALQRAIAEWFHSAGLRDLARAIEAEGETCLD